MAIVQHLSVLAVRTLFEGFCKSIGFEAGAAAADAAVKFLGSRFTDQAGRLGTALTRATSNSWRALEVALAGDSWWDRVKLALARREDQAFREQVQAFLRSAPLPGHAPDFLRRCGADLKAARKGNALSGPLDAAALARRAADFARYSDPHSLLDAEWAAVADMALAVREVGHAALADFLGLRTGSGLPLLVVSVRYFFRREVETDAQLFQGLAFAQMERLGHEQELAFANLGAALSGHADRLET